MFQEILVMSLLSIFLISFDESNTLVFSSLWDIRKLNLIFLTENVFVETKAKNKAAESSVIISLV